LIEVSQLLVNTAMITVYGDIKSGNCYKIALLFSQLDIEHQWKEILVVKGETRTDQFRALNPAGQIPVVLLENGEVLTQSNAILNYFADGTDLMPADALHRARVQEWQFYEQYNHEPTIAVRRYIKMFLGLPAARQAEFDSKEESGYRALSVMESHLAKHQYLVGKSYSVADISLYAYTHVAEEGDFDLSRFPGICDWLARVKQQPGHISMSD